MSNIKELFNTDKPQEAAEKQKITDNSTPVTDGIKLSAVTESIGILLAFSPSETLQTVGGILALTAPYILYRTARPAISAKISKIRHNMAEKQFD